MWQQRSLDISGLLYWSTTYCEKANPWESTKTWDDYNSAGDGMLIYPGGYIALTARLLHSAYEYRRRYGGL